MTKVLLPLAMTSSGLAVLGPVLAQVGLPPPLALNLFLVGAGLGGVVLARGLIRVTRTPEDASKTRLGWAVVGLGAIPVLLVAQALVRGIGAPAINDVTTDVSRPPEFEQATAPPGTAQRDLRYPEAFRAAMRSGYPKLHSLHLNLPPEQAFPRVLAAAQAMSHWEVTTVDTERGRLQATARTRAFRFVDDVVIRLEPEGHGSRLDMRSRSRFGKGDLGANARRIESFFRSVQRTSALADREGLG